jgi:hypothetical protein
MRCIKDVRDASRMPLRDRKAYAICQIFDLDVELLRVDISNA